MADYLQSKSKRPFTVIYNDILDDEELNLHEIAVYIALKRFASNDTMTCFPSLVTIAKKARICRASVQKAIDGLIEKGYIEKRQRYDESKKEYHSNVYILMDEKKVSPEQQQDKELEKLKELAAKLGYTISKDDQENLLDQAGRLPNQGHDQSNDLVNAPDQSRNDSQVNSQRIDQEPDTMKTVKESCDYEGMIADNPELTDAIDSAMQIITDTINDPGEAQDIKAIFKKLKKDDVIYSIRKLQEAKNVKNHVSYLKRILARANTQKGLEKLPPREKSVKKPIQFNDFEQRKYDYKELERKLSKIGRGRRR